MNSVDRIADENQNLLCGEYDDDMCYAGEHISCTRKR